jgi:hypothetical protein
VTLRAAIVGLLFCSACCGERPKVPCLPWVREGHRYRVELLQHFDSVHDDDWREPEPYSRYLTPEVSCGGGVDIDEGSIVSMAAGGRIEGDGHSGCSEGCYYTGAKPEIASVKWVGPAPDVTDVGPSDFSTVFAAEIAPGCQVDYRIGIAPVSAEFLEGSDQFVVSDHMLFRRIAVRKGSSCTGLGQVMETGTCWDSWSARVFDEDGRRVTRDLPPVPGVRDAAGDDEDGGG